MGPGTKTAEVNEARWRVVEEHIAHESAHELKPLVETFGNNSEWHNKPTDDVLHGADSIHGFYADLFIGFPDFALDVRNRRAAGDAIVLEGSFGGTHNGRWMGIPATGRKVSVPFCALFTFTEDDRIKAEIVYYDRLTILEQLGAVPGPA